MTKETNEWIKLLEKGDSLPCPYCGEPTILLDYSGNPLLDIWKKADGYQCVNNNCVNRRAWMACSVYYSEIRYAIKRIEDEFKYTEKAKKFLQNFQVDRRKAKDFCDHCNSKIESCEIHFPITKTDKGKVEKYCEVRIKRIRK